MTFVYLIIAHYQFVSMFILTKILAAQPERMLEMSYKYINTKHEGIFEYKTKTGKKLFRVRFKHEVDGQLQEISKQGFNKISAAKSFKQDITRLISDNQFNFYAERDRTLEKHWQEYKNLKVRNKKWNAHTLETNESRIQFWLSDFGDKTLRSLQSEDLQNHIDDMYGEHDYSQETMNGFYRVLNQVLKDALGENYISKNPLVRVSYFKTGEWRPKKKTLSLADYKIFMNTAEEVLDVDMYCAIYLLGFGLRRGEVYGIRKNAITFNENNTATIEINWTRTPKHLDGKPVKSDSSERVIVVNDVAASLLKKQIARARHVKMRVNNEILHENDYIFISYKFGTPFHLESLNDAMKQVTKLCGIHAHPHMFRHTFATNASALGIDGIMLQNFLGHADVDMTAHYAHNSIESAENVMRMTESLRENL